MVWYKVTEGITEGNFCGVMGKNNIKGGAVEVYLGIEEAYMVLIKLGDEGELSN